MKKNICWTVASIGVLFVLPLLAANFAGQSGMALCFILFYAVNPVLFVLQGISLGKTFKKSFFIPLVSSVIYLISMWLVFDMGETDFIIYSAVYFVVGTVVMAITGVVNYFVESRRK